MPSHYAPCCRSGPALRSVRARPAVLTLRCTERVRARLRLPERLPEAPHRGAPSGDWYVHLVRFQGVVASETTLEKCDIRIYN